MIDAAEPETPDAVWRNLRRFYQNGCSKSNLARFGAVGAGIELLLRDRLFFVCFFGLIEDICGLTLEYFPLHS